MEDAKRFIRYVIPGLSSFLQLLVVCLIYWHLDISKIVTYLNLSTAAGIILISGIIGYIFSNAYYILYWKFSVYKHSKHPNHSKLDFIEVLKIQSKIFKDIIDVDTLSDQKEAWVIMNVYSKVTDPKKFEALEKQSENLFNVLFSIGTTIIILILSCLLGCCFLAKNLCDPTINILLYPFGNIFVIAFLIANYRILTKIIQRTLIRTSELKLSEFEESIKKRHSPI
jgi:hypothetical protein